MTSIEIQLPDKLVQDAQAAGLLTPEAIERLLLEQLRKQAGEALREMWARMPREELTPEIAPKIADVPTVVTPRLPRVAPIPLWTTSTRRCATLPRPISSPAKMKNGIDSSENELTEPNRF